MADLKASLENLGRAFARLDEFASLPVTHQRDQAGVVQAFEFTFELFWKTFQKLAPELGLQATSPRQAIQAGLRMGAIPIEDEAAWGLMLRDRNQTSHLYNDQLAKEVFLRVVQQYLPAFSRALENLRAYVARGGIG